MILVCEMHIRASWIAVAALVGSALCTAMLPTTTTCPASLQQFHQGASFCITPQELALGEKPLHMFSIPDQVFLHAGISLTTEPGRTTHVSMQKALQTANAFAQLPHPSSIKESAVLAEEHSPLGKPAEGRLVWIVNLTRVKDGNAFGWSDFVVVDAQSGSVDYEFIQSPANPDPAYP